MNAIAEKYRLKSCKTERGKLKEVLDEKHGIKCLVLKKSKHEVAITCLDQSLKDEITKIAPGESIKVWFIIRSKPGSYGYYTRLYLMKIEVVSRKKQEELDQRIADAKYARMNNLNPESANE